MLKSTKTSLAIALGLLLSLTMFTSGAFAQSAGRDNKSVPVYAVVGTNAILQNVGAHRIREWPVSRVGFTRTQINHVRVTTKRIVTTQIHRLHMINVARFKRARIVNNPGFNHARMIDMLRFQHARLINVANIKRVHITETHVDRTQIKHVHFARAHHGHCDADFQVCH
ncbi:MAG TPA: hypothetical protein VFV38_06875 [Ktedonobacteraceae bacterium]|nr:hypothetical protein [Ktedonobacteraceae bacterium]